MPLMIKTPVVNLANSCKGLAFPSLEVPQSLNVRKLLSLEFSIAFANMFGNGADKKMAITQSGLQLLYNAHDSNINRKPDARNADRNMILFNGFIYECG